MIQKGAFYLTLGILFMSCSSEKQPLPYLGFTEIINGDTLHHKIPDFSFLNQDGQVVSNDSYKDQIYVADFFFVHCPSICPKVTQQMLRIHDRYKDDSRIKLVAHTLDPDRDSIPVLRDYAAKIGVKSQRWDFLIGKDDETLEIADQYFVPAFKDPDAPGGFDHSGKLILVDRNRHVRGFAEGTDPESVTQFFKTIDQLLNEEFPKS